VWFSDAPSKKRGVTAESLLIGGAVAKKAAPAKKAAVKKTKRAPVKKSLTSEASTNKGIRKVPFFVE